MKTKKILSLAVSVLLIFSIIPYAAANEIVNTEVSDVYDVISSGIGSAQSYLQNQLINQHNDGGVGYGFEWYIIAMLRAQKEIDEEILNEYYSSVAQKIKEFDENTKPTDIERTALAMLVSDKDITNIDGVNLLELIYNNEGIQKGANELAYALITFNATDIELPENAIWNENKLADELLKFVCEDGGFGLYDNTSSDVDITAICIQALAPYIEDENIERVLNDAVEYLKRTVSQDFICSDNPNSTAQILLALASLKLDVTDSENGFGNEEKNIITALEKYRNTDENGYFYGDTVNPMATVQVMQAYDAYRKVHKENLMYWDFSNNGNEYDDEIPEEENDSNDEAAQNADVYITIVSDGSIVKNKNGEYVAQSKVTVTDINKDGKLSVDEALYAAHEEYYEGGAEEGYYSYVSAYGLSLSVLWGKGTKETSAAAGYYLNNESCLSLEDTIEGGDYITAFNYNDAIYYSDSYSFFNENEVSVAKGDSVTLTLNYLGYDENFNTVVNPCSDAKVVFLGSNNAFAKALTTDKNGNVKIKFEKTAASGTYYVMTYKEDKSIVPAICKITVTADGGNSGGSTSKNITVRIKVADPKGTTYLKKTSCSVEKGTTVFELLKKTGLNIKIESNVYGAYVKEIEGLAELDKGEESGWMYSVNGAFPNYSASLYSLSSGDYVEWLYTRNLGKDLKKSNSSSSSSGSVKSKDENNKTNAADITDKVITDTASYMYKTVSAPEIGSVGGDWLVFGLARSEINIPGNYFENYYQKVEDYVKDCKGVLHNKKITEYARVILSLTAIGKDAENVGGYNILTPLGDYEITTIQGINGPVWALIALDSGKYEMPVNNEANIQATREMYVDYILEKQNADGGWSLTGTASDIDITGMVLQALSNYQHNANVKTAVEKALCFISLTQNEAGGFENNGEENAESCAQILVALCELGIDLEDTRFIKNDKTILNNLLSFYDGTNGFKHIHNGSVNQMTTEQCFYALVAYKRASEGKNSLYDMSDVRFENNENINAGLTGKHSDIKKTEVIYPDKTFCDIAGHIRQSEIEQLAARGIISGKDENSFEPDSTMTRAELTAIIVRGLNLPEKSNSVFTDVALENWFCSYVNTAYSYGIVKGISEKLFNPNGAISREEASVILTRAANLCGIDTQISDDAARDILCQFPDYIKAAIWARGSLAFCYKSKILSDDTLNINPQESVTRAEIADMLYNMLDLAKLL